MRCFRKESTLIYGNHSKSLANMWEMYRYMDYDIFSSSSVNYLIDTEAAKLVIENVYIDKLISNSFPRYSDIKIQAQLISLVSIT